MKLDARLRRLFLVIASLLLLGLSWTGITGGIRQFPQSTTTGQFAQTAMQLAFGLFAALSLVTTFWQRRWEPVIAVCWAVSVALASGLAAVVWGGTSLLKGILSAVGGLLIALGITWLLRSGAVVLVDARNRREAGQDPSLRSR